MLRNFIDLISKGTKKEIEISSTGRERARVIVHSNRAWNHSFLLKSPSLSGTFVGSSFL